MGTPVRKIYKNEITKIFMDLERCNLPVHRSPELKLHHDEAKCEHLGKFVFALYTKYCPKTCENFVELLKRKDHGYKHTQFHRIINNFMMQGGDIDHKQGEGGSSIWNAPFPDENFKFKHSRPGILSMANTGPNTNNSQFFITFRD